MGALLVASVSSFTSCKDYDDDINSLKEDIKKAALQSKLDELANTVNGVSSTASNALNLANAAATKTDLDTKAGQLAKDIQSVEAIAKAAKEAAENIDLTPFAKKTDLEGLATKEDLTNAAAAAENRIKDALADYITAKAVDEKIADLKAQVDKCLTEEDIEEVTKKVDAAIDGVKAIWGAITGIELYGTLSADGGLDEDIWEAMGKSLTLRYGYQKENKLGPNSELVYTKDKYIDAFEDGIVVRVNPANADLSKVALENITLRNSKGEILDDVVAKGVKVYDKLITRAGNNGLWIINFARKDVKAADFTKHTEDGTPAKKIMFAVGINNTADASKERVILSTYDLQIDQQLYTPEYYLNFAAKDTEVDNIRNRWDGFNIKSETVTDATGLAELMWNPYNTPAVKIDNTTTQNENRNAEKRQGTKALSVQVNKAFEVKLTAHAGTPSVSSLFNPEDIEYFWVSLAEKDAIESSPSEINAWKGYGITGLNVVKKASETVSITIPAAAAVGDYVTFRVFAVNYDGTLSDPDGRAFTVFVGNEGSNIVTDAITVTQDAGSIGYSSGKYKVSSSKNSKSSALTGPFSACDPAGTTTDVPMSNADGTLTGVLTVALLDENGANTTDWTKMKSVAYAIKDATDWKDGATLTGVLEGKSGSNVVNTVTFNITKNLPTAFGTATWKTAQPGDPQNTNKYIAYMYPSTTNQLTTTAQPYVTGATNFSATWSSAAAVGYKNMVQAMNDLDANYIFTVEKVRKDDDNNYTLASAFKAKSASIIDIAVDRAIVDGVERNANWYYKYTDVSSEATTKPYIYQDETTTDNSVYIAGTPFTITFACPLDPTVMVYSWDSEVRNVPVATWGGAVGAPTTPVNAKITDVYVLYSNIAGGIFADIEYTDANGNKFTATNYQLGTTTPEFLAYTNSFDNEPFKRTAAPNLGKYYFMGANYVGKGTGILSTPWAHDFKVTITTDANSKEEYFKGSYMDAGTLTLEKNSESTNPTTPVQSTFKIQAVDAFGHSNTIVSLPIKVKNT